MCYKIDLILENQFKVKVRQGNAGGMVPTYIISFTLSLLLQLVLFHKSHASLLDNVASFNFIMTLPSRALERST